MELLENLLIRLATPSDIPALVRMGRKFWSQTAYRAIPYCPDSIAAHCTQMLSDRLLLMGELEGRVCGSVGAVLGPLYANRSVLVATELWWWVNEDARNSGIGRELLSGIESAAKAVGASIMGMIALDAVEPEKAKAIYSACGYVPAEHTFMKLIGETWQE